MNNTLRTILIAAAVFVIGTGLLFAGAAIGRAFWWSSNGFFGPGGMMGYSGDAGDGSFGYGGGMMDGWTGGPGSFGPGMGGYYDQDDSGALPFSSRGYGGGMMDGGSGGPGSFGPGLDGCYDQDDSSALAYESCGYGGGMMGTFGYAGGEDLPVLSIDDVQETLETYVEGLGIDNLEIEEIMIFSNHAYAEIVETDTGVGAFEVLVDPLTGAVSPEPGPNMMWNLKYGMHGEGMMGGGGMMDGFDFNPFDSAAVDAETTVSEDQAVELAQEFLDANYPGLTADDHADTFYGYYTLHTLEDGEITGMLSVNGYSGDVFPHTWHGDFIEMTHEDDH